MRDGYALHQACGQAVLGTHRRGERQAVSFSGALSAAQAPDDLVYADTILKQGLAEEIAAFKRLVAHPKRAGRCSCSGSANLITNAIGEVNDVAGTSLPILA